MLPLKPISYDVRFATRRRNLKPFKRDGDFTLRLVMLLSDFLLRSPFVSQKKNKPLSERLRQKSFCLDSAGEIATRHEKKLLLFQLPTKPLNKISCSLPHGENVPFSEWRENSMNEGGKTSSRSDSFCFRHKIDIKATPIEISRCKC